MKTKSVSSLKNERGQFLIESILLMVLSIGLLSMGVKILREKKVVSNIVSGPWLKTAGMVENGVWRDPSSGRSLHPNTGTRGRLLDPKLK